MKTLIAALSLLSATAINAEKPDAAAPNSATAVDLRVESQTNPTAVNNPLPKFSWRIKTGEQGWLQKTYRILVASSEDLLEQEKADIWDSGDTPGRETIFIEYGGRPFETGQKVFWKVRSGNFKGTSTGWSEVANFTVNLSGPPKLEEPLFKLGMPKLSTFECDNDNLNEIYRLSAEQLHLITSLRDISTALRGAAYHQELLPRGRTWANELNHSIDAANFFPAKLPSDGTYGCVQSDSALTSMHALWWMSGDVSIIKNHWSSMYKYTLAREKLDPESKGIPFGQLPPDTLPDGDPTPPEFVNLAYRTMGTRLMLELSPVGGQNPLQNEKLNILLEALREGFKKAHLQEDGTLHHDSLTANLLLLRSALLETDEQKEVIKKETLKLVKQAGKDSFTQSPTTVQSLLPVLTWIGRHDLAAKIALQQKAEDLSPLELATISEWLISMLAGIDTIDAGFQSIWLHPYIPPKEILSRARATYQAPTGEISVSWKYEGNDLVVQVIVPPNTTALVQLPLAADESIREDGEDVSKSKRVYSFERQGNLASFRLLSGNRTFRVGK